MPKIWQTIMNLTGWNIKMQINLFWLFLVFFSLAALSGSMPPLVGGRWASRQRRGCRCNRNQWEG